MLPKAVKAMDLINIARFQYIIDLPSCQTTGPGAVGRPSDSYIWKVSEDRMFHLSLLNVYNDCVTV